MRPNYHILIPASARPMSSEATQPAQADFVPVARPFRVGAAGLGRGGGRAIIYSTVTDLAKFLG